MDPRSFIFDTPLYSWVSVDKDFLKSLATTPKSRNNPRFDGYNPISGCDSTFELNNGFRYSPLDYSLIEDEFVMLELECTRKEDKMYVFVQVDYEQMKMRKIGQFPSVADVHIAQIKQYSKVVNYEDLKDLTRAIGLAANGIGIGSFVYLRRIFENLIIEASKTCISKGLIDPNAFDASRMDEKIAMIKEELPDFLYENRKMYGIISKGIHELSEEECLSMFDVLRGSIEMILEEKLISFQREKRKKGFRKTLQTWHHS